MRDRRVSTRASCKETPDCSKTRKAVVAVLTLAWDGAVKDDGGGADVGVSVVAVGDVISRLRLWQCVRKTSLT